MKMNRWGSDGVRLWTTISTIGLPAISTSGFGNVYPRSANRFPSPPIGITIWIMPSPPPPPLPPIDESLDPEVVDFRETRDLADVSSRSSAGLYAVGGIFHDHDFLRFASQPLQRFVVDLGVGFCALDVLVAHQDLEID